MNKICIIIDMILYKPIINKNINKSIKLLNSNNLNNNNLLEDVFEYCIMNNLNNLKMVIGATGKNTKDNDRLGKDYDLSIDYVSNYPNSLDELITLNHDDNNIYDKLNHILNEKFSQIIFDWSVSKFLKNEELEKILINLGNLLKKEGKIYIDEFSSISDGGLKGIIWLAKENNKYFLETNKFDIITHKYTSEKRKILKNEKDNFTKKRLIYVIKDNQLNKIYENIDYYKLFDNMDNEGYFEEKMLTNIYSYKNESLEILTKLFPNNFNIEYFEDNNYPNNKDRINNYWVITKL